MRRCETKNSVRAMASSKLAKVESAHRPGPRAIRSRCRRGREPRAPPARRHRDRASARPAFVRRESGRCPDSAARIRTPPAASATALCTSRKSSKLRSGAPPPPGKSRAQAAAKVITSERDPRRDRQRDRHLRQLIAGRFVVGDPERPRLERGNPRLQNLTVHQPVVDAHEQRLAHGFFSRTSSLASMIDFCPAEASSRASSAASAVLRAQRVELEQHR